MIVTNKLCKLFLILLVSMAVLAFIYKIPVFLKKYFLQKNYHPNIVFNAMTKSGSEYIAKSLVDGLSYQRKDFESIYNYENKTNFSNMNKFFSRNSKVAKQHFSAKRFSLPDGLNFIWVLDLEKYSKYTNKIVVHVRDPRQAVLSRTHHTVFYRRGGPFSLDLPANYFSLPLHDQISWNIEHYLPTIVAWLQTWIEIKKQEDAKLNGLKILFTKYDELLTDEKELFIKIVSFFDIDPRKFKHKPVAKTSNVNYRKGDPNEWKTQITQVQIERMNELIPKDILTYFNWE